MQRYLQCYADSVTIVDVLSQGRNVNDTVADQSRVEFIYSYLNKEITQKNILYKITKRVNINNNNGFAMLT